MKTMLIKAVKTENGYVLEGVNPDGETEYPQEGRAHTSRRKAYKDCKAMYDNNAWHGRKVNGGYRIDIT